MALVDPNNTSSIRLLEHMKMKIEDKNKGKIGKKGKKFDDITYMISAKEWKQSRKKEN